MHQTVPPSKQTRVYVDMVGDLFHVGHVTLLKAARELGDWLIVGVLSDEVVESYKRRPIMSLAERAAVIEACRYVDEIILNAPDRVTTDFLERHEISFVVHGDDFVAGSSDHVYAEVAAAGKLRLVPRTGAISTTELIRRVRERASELPL
jgi:cytidyltransferase-like protein